MRQNLKMYFRILPLWSVSAFSALLVENFKARSPGALDGQGEWQALSGVEVVSGGVNYSSGSIVVEGGERHARSQGVLSPTTNAPLATRSFPAQSGEVWFSFTFRVENSVNNSRFWFWVSSTTDLNSGLTASIGDNDTGAKRIAAEIRNNTTPASTASSGFSEGAVTFVIGRLSKEGNATNADAYDRLELWVNPHTVELGEPTAVANGPAGSSFTGGIAHFGITALSSGADLHWDNLRIGSLRADVLDLYHVAIADQGDIEPPIPGAWTLEFEDSFPGNSLDGTKWRMGTHHAGIAGQAGNSPENIVVSDGTLKLIGEHRPVTYSGSNYAYASGEISTFFQFTQLYGYIEARIRKPLMVQGLWPAFWLMPDRENYGNHAFYRRAYLKFDLAGETVPAVNEAKLVLTVYHIQGGSSSNNMVVMPLEDSDWSESTITWNNKPVPDPRWLAQVWNLQGVPGDTVEIDITDHVQRRLNEDGAISLVLADTFMRAQLIQFHSKESATPDARPRLVIDGVEYSVTEDATVQWGTQADINLGSQAVLSIADDWRNTATTSNGGMEVDIMESLGIWGANTTTHVLHWDGYGADQKSAASGQVSYAATTDGFHRYGLYWEPGRMEFYIDGVHTWSFESERVMSVPAYLILSLQMGGWGGNVPNPGVHNRVMEVDWVRAWSGTKAAPYEEVIHNREIEKTNVVGEWPGSTGFGGYLGPDYQHDNNSGKGEKSFTFHFSPPETAEYEVYARWVAAGNRATQVPIDIVEADGTVTTVFVNQRLNSAEWVLLGTFTLGIGNASVTLRTDGTNDGFVIADGARILGVNDYIPGASTRNLIHEALGLPENYPFPPFNPVRMEAEGKVEYVWFWTRPKAGGDLVTVVEITHDLTSDEWSGSPDHVVTEVTEESDTHERVTVRVSGSLEDFSRVFLRVRASLQESP